MNAHDLIQEIIERKGKIENVFWIACGGSMIDLMPANELLKREATTFTSTVYTAREFCLMAPKSLGPKSLSSPAATAAIRRRSSTAARWRWQPAPRSWP